MAWPWSAAVHAEDGVCYLVFAASRQDLTHLIARYIAERAPYVLWPPDAERVLALLDAGYVEGAIDVYFARVGHRWDDEWLCITLSRDDQLPVGARCGRRPDVDAERGRRRHESAVAAERVAG